MGKGWSNVFISVRNEEGEPAGSRPDAPQSGAAGVKLQETIEDAAKGGALNACERVFESNLSVPEARKAGRNTSAEMERLTTESRFRSKANENEAVREKERQGRKPLRRIWNVEAFIPGNPFILRVLHFLH